MKREHRQKVLTAIAVASMALLVLFLTNLDLARDAERPDDAQTLAAWIAARPADWLAAASLSGRSLDSALPRRVELWRASYAMARHLAPLRPNTDAGFVRAGLFHWYELGAPDRKAVLDVAAKMMRDPQMFAALYKPLWELTRDFAWLRRVTPRELRALSAVHDIAILYGRFADYRDLRETIRAERIRVMRARRATATIQELHELLPPRLETADEPLVQIILEELDRRAFDPQHVGGRIEDVTTFAIEHDVQPLTALAPLLEMRGSLRDVTRARLALALGNRDAATRIEMTSAVHGAREWLPYYLERAELEARRGDAGAVSIYRTRIAMITATMRPDPWRDMCGPGELCTTASRIHEGPLQFTLSVGQSDEVPPYVEIHVDDALVFEGPIAGARTFEVGGPGVHRTDVRLVNRYTRAGVQRRVRLS